MDEIITCSTYKVTTSKETFYFDLRHATGGYYVFFKDNYNDVLFSKYNINKVKFAQEILGYYNNGMFPFCKTIADCEKLLMALIDKIKEKDPSISTNFIFGNLESYWDD